MLGFYGLKITTFDHLNDIGHCVDRSSSFNYEIMESALDLKHSRKVGK